MLVRDESYEAAPLSAHQHIAHIIEERNSDSTNTWVSVRRRKKWITKRWEWTISNGTSSFPVFIFLFVTFKFHHFRRTWQLSFACHFIAGASSNESANIDIQVPWKCVTERTIYSSFRKNYAMEVIIVVWNACFVNTIHSIFLWISFTARLFATEPQPYRIQNHQKRQPNPRTETRARQWHFLNNKSWEVVKPGGVRHCMSSRVAASPSWWRYWKRQVSRIPSARYTCYFIISCRQFPPFLSC